MYFDRTYICILVKFIFGFYLLENLYLHFARTFIYIYAHFEDHSIRERLISEKIKASVNLDSARFITPASRLDS